MEAASGNLSLAENTQSRIEQMISINKRHQTGDESSSHSGKKGFVVVLVLVFDVVVVSLKMSMKIFYIESSKKKTASCTWTYRKGRHFVAPGFELRVLLVSWCMW